MNLAKLTSFIERTRNDEYETFSAMVCAALAALDYTDNELAVALDVSRPTISRWKNAKSEPHALLQRAVNDALLVVASRAKKSEQQRVRRAEKKCVKKTQHQQNGGSQKRAYSRRGASKVRGRSKASVLA